MRLSRFKLFFVTCAMVIFAIINFSGVYIADQRIAIIKAAKNGDVVFNVKFFQDTIISKSGEHNQTSRTKEKNKVATKTLDSGNPFKSHRVKKAAVSGVATCYDIDGDDGKGIIKNIVLYHPYHQELLNLTESVDMSQCVFKNCKISVHNYSTSRCLNAAAVVVQGQHMRRKVPMRKDFDQPYIFVSTETPRYLAITDYGCRKYKNLYNWTMTYRLDSDIPLPYGSIISKHTNAASRKQTSNELPNDTGQFETLDEYDFEEIYGKSGKSYSDVFRKKTGSVAWLVSHCLTASQREKYVSMMNTTIDIKVYGKCNNNSDECPKGTSCDDYIAGQFKFYLAFENSMCTDYITEKVFNWYEKDIVLVVRGARKYSKYLPKGTYIDSANFKSPKHLAQYLNKIGNNKEKYTEFLRRKDQYRVLGHKFHATTAYCEICKRLNDINTYRKSYVNVKNWWNRTCTTPTDI